MTFGDLKSRLLDILGRAPASVVYEMVTADINQQLRAKEMEATETLAEAASITLPTDFLAVVEVYRDANPRTPLEATTPEAISALYQTSGTPSSYAIADGVMLLDKPGSGNLELRYYARLSDLSADSDENDILTYYPAIYVYGALYHHAALIRDMEAAGAYSSAYGAAMRSAQSATVKDRHSGSPVRVVPRGATP